MAIPDPENGPTKGPFMAFFVPFWDPMAGKKIQKQGVPIAQLIISKGII